MWPSYSYAIGLLRTLTHSKTELSFWSPQMRISAMDLSVSTSRLRLASVTVWLRLRIEYKCLGVKKRQR